MELKILKQIDQLGCGISCISMLCGLKGGSLEAHYYSCVKKLFSNYPEIKKHQRMVDVRTKIGQLQSYLRYKNIDSKRIKLKQTEQFFPEYGVVLALIEANNWLHWVLIFKVNSGVFVVDPECGNYYEFNEYFSYDGYQICENRHHLYISKFQITKVTSFDYMHNKAIKGDALHSADLV